MSYLDNYFSSCYELYQEYNNKIRKKPLLLIGFTILVMMCLIAIFAPIIAPHDPNDQSLKDRFKSPCLEYPLGTDQFGRCIFSRIVYGSQTSLAVAVITTIIVVFIGLLVGLYAGYYRKLDGLLMRVTDIMLAFPSMVITLALVGIFGPSIPTIISALAIPGWAKYARVTRSTTLSIKNRGYVQSARALGAKDRYIIFKHILPNSLAPIMEIATLGLGGKIISIAGLGFLGLGIQPPTPEWGTIMNQGLPYLGKAPLITLSAGAMILVFVLSSNLIGSEIRDVMDPKTDSIIL
ncbi:binding-protein-dependent transport systems inner membrane component [Methanospirillum hungatei JF-1]|jgi:peptide/nickel transport system permease protein|uniref:Binding-protein-dependent transport systems inner membrane component n=1 Tax=Methanospirillum hungatei JF-1 (strain ATCC 27890 / DSM 864 / NBRC 100397 / JF-1) TaxID=323259 RepID=Q2FPU1_METHJ|nr:ABC transporter permease [Methanospirillum hungatei]ABD39984.1 binding-protein-dependent transport systems inner membrane component [Methanospirillum hungatei JF-1]